MTSPNFKYDDGGRRAAGFTGNTGDCVCRAIAIATGKPYAEVYRALWSGLKSHGENHRDTGSQKESTGWREQTARPRANGVNRKIYDNYLRSLGWKFTPTMSIGSGCKVQMYGGGTPAGIIIARVSKHLVTVIDGVVHDAFDPSRDGTRCVYGYYTASNAAPVTTIINTGETKCTKH